MYFLRVSIFGIENIKNWRKHIRKKEVGTAFLKMDIIESSYAWQKGQGICKKILLIFYGKNKK